MQAEPTTITFCSYSEDENEMFLTFFVGFLEYHHKCYENTTLSALKWEFWGRSVCRQHSLSKAAWLIWKLCAEHTASQETLESYFKKKRPPSSSSLSPYTSLYLPTLMLVFDLRSWKLRKYITLHGKLANLFASSV